MGCRSWVVEFFLEVLWNHFATFMATTMISIHSIKFGTDWTITCHFQASICCITQEACLCRQLTILTVRHRYPRPFLNKCHVYLEKHLGCGRYNITCYDSSVGSMWYHDYYWKLLKQILINSTISSTKIVGSLVVCGEDQSGDPQQNSLAAIP